MPFAVVLFQTWSDSVGLVEPPGVPGARAASTDDTLNGGPTSQEADEGPGVACHLK